MDFFQPVIDIVGYVVAAILGFGCFCVFPVWFIWWIWTWNDRYMAKCPYCFNYVQKGATRCGGLDGCGGDWSQK